MQTQSERITHRKRHSKAYDFQYENIPVLPQSVLPQPGGQRLIDSATNAWTEDRHHANPDDSDSDYLGEDEDDRWTPPKWLRSIQSSRHKQRLLVAFVIMLLSLWIAWRLWVWPRWQERAAISRSLDGRHASQGGYGSNITPRFTDLVQVKSVSRKLIKKAEEKGQRLVAVGDVHGCKEQLTALLDKISFRPGFDHLILTGDIIAKGPDSGGVVDLARSLSAFCVRGNHEDRILLTHREMRAKRPPNQAPSAQDRSNRQTARSLTKKQVKWLKECPVILRLGYIEGLGETIVVHAGLVPGVALDKQDPYQVMNMRTIDLETLMPSELREGTPWEKLWNCAQERLPPHERSTVIYGHDAKRGLNIQPYTKGIDSGCVKGGRLTALVIEPLEGRPANVSLEYVECSSNAGVGS